MSENRRPPSDQNGSARKWRRDWIARFCRAAARSAAMIAFVELADWRTGRPAPTTLKVLGKSYGEITT
jgi:hypothetical protein